MELVKTEVGDLEAPQNSKLVKLYYPDVKEDMYLISENGYVWSNYKQGFMQPKVDKDGYLSLKLRGKNKKVIYPRIASLVAWTFLGAPSGLKDPTVNHIDGNRINNYYLNLEWVERGYNSSIRKNTGCGENNPSAKLNAVLVKEICELLQFTNLSTKEIAERYNVSRSSILNIQNKSVWKEIVDSYDFSSRKIVRNKKGQYETINLLVCSCEGEENFGSSGKN